MSEHIAHMGPTLALVGLTAGWVVDAASRADGYGLISDTVRALIGSMVAGSTGWVEISVDAGMLGMFLIGGGGAALAIIARRRSWRSARRGPWASSRR